MAIINFRKKLIFFLLIYLIGSNSFCLADPNSASRDSEQEISPTVSRQSQTLVINIHGKISKLLLEKFRKITQKLPLESQFPPTLLVTLDSNGGDGEAAIEIGKILRTYHAHVFVTNRCGSACVFTFAGGEFRASLPSSIGIHQARVTISDNGARIIKELDLSKSESAQNLLSNFDKKAADYLLQMGLAEDFYERIQNQKTKELYWLDEKEVEKYKLNGFTTEALNSTIKQLSEKSAVNIDQNKLLRNSEEVLKECVYFKNEPNNFARCYINVMNRS
jgi:ATP-dependent protease ClpP protease subunit